MLRNAEIAVYLSHKTSAGGLVGLRQGDNRYYYIFDGLGSVVGLTDSSGTLINTYSYDPYGNILNQTEAVAPAL